MVWAPLPFGSNRPWATALLFLLTASLLAGWLVLHVAGRVTAWPGWWRAVRWPLLLLASLQGWIFLQTLPLPREWVAALSPRAALLHLPGERVPLSLDAALTRFQFLQGLTYLAVFMLVTLLLHQRERITGFLWAIVVSGALQAGYGTLMTLSGLEYGFFVEKYTGEGVATGTFVNRNHLAGYLVMALAAGIGLLISRLGGEAAFTMRARLRAWLTLLLSTKFLLRLLLALMVIGLVLTRSRMGNLAFFMSMSLAGVVVLLCARRVQFGKVALLLASLLLVDLLIVGRWFGADELAERLVETTTAGESRDEVSTYSLQIISDFPWTGSGAGTFYTVFPHYSQAALQGDYYTHAHNDFVELAGDLGLPAFLVLAAFVLSTLLRAFLMQYHDDGRLLRGVGFTVLMVIGWAFVHSTADFNLYIPANGLTCTALLALAWLDSRAGFPGKRGEIPGGYARPRQ